MKILMTGATGLIGRALVQKLINEGHQLSVVSRNRQKAASELPTVNEIIECDLLKTPLSIENFSNVDIVIHLLGESIDGRWTAHKKKEIFDSRVLSSKNLLLNAPKNLKALISASAVGYYGDCGEQVITETSKPGSDFLAEVCQKWEDSLQVSKSTRKVILRLGVVLSPQGGALKKLKSLFQKNLGAPLGTGKQWMSWVSLEDVVALFSDAVRDTSYEGVVNVTHPKPVRNIEFTKALCESLNVIQLPAVPAFILKILLGEMSQMILFSCRAESLVLQKKAFQFKDVDLTAFLKRAFVESRAK
jgi:uncharacterized protein